LRHIDRVTVKGSIDPVDIYTLDCSYENMAKHCEYTNRFDSSKILKSVKKKLKVL